MTRLFYYAVVLNALSSVVVAAISYWRNRLLAVGPLVGLAMSGFALWLWAFAYYFQPLPEAEAILWAKITLTFGILNSPMFFHMFCTLVERARKFRWWIVAGYLSALFFTVLCWRGDLILGLKFPPFMDHYVRYDRHWYPWLGLHIVVWQWFGIGLLVHSARRAVGFKRTQLVYFIVAWCVAFLAGNSIIIPIEYDLYIMPYGFFIMPLMLALLAYAMARARLADFNVAVAKMLMYLLALVIIAAVCLVFIGGMTWVSPGFLNMQQIMFTVGLVVVIGCLLASILPQWLPRAERLVQERMFGGRFGYQDTLSGLVKELSHLATLDEILATAVSRVHSEMQLTRAMILMQNPLSGDFELQVESGLTAAERPDSIRLAGDAAIIHWLEAQPGALVRDELPRRTDEHTLRLLETELAHLKMVVCVPLVLEKRLLGVLCLGEKINREMFYVSDLRVLETLAAEVALAIRYRRLEEQVMHQNKLVELGTIAAGIAHEIRNPLASVRTFAQLLPDKLDDPEFRTNFSQMVLQDVDRITKVIQSMLAFARPGTVNIAEYPATDLVDEAVMLVQSRLKSKRIELTKLFHERPMLRVDKQQILQVLVNLLNNAAEALPEGGRIRVATGTHLMEALDRGARKQRFAVIEITDNGPGIPATVRNRLFDPFFTTKKDGTGLGLSISQKIVRDHGGIITVSSIEGKGTSFQVNLPLEPETDKIVQTQPVFQQN